jgi:hypothetical protein
MRITVEHAISDDAIAAFYRMYAAAFDPLRTKAAARHLLTVEEFAAEMTDERIDKYVVWGDGDRPLGLATLATDLSAVPWISPEYFSACYPEHMSRGAVYYLGFTLVDPGHEREGVFALIAARVVRRLSQARAVCAFDVCGYNDDVHQIGRSITALSRSLDVNVDTLDVQTYYAAAFSGPRRKAAV